MHLVKNMNIISRPSLLYGLPVRLSAPVAFFSSRGPTFGRRPQTTDAADPIQMRADSQSNHSQWPTTPPMQIACKFSSQTQQGTSSMQSLTFETFKKIFQRPIGNNWRFFLRLSLNFVSFCSRK